MTSAYCLAWPWAITAGRSLAYYIEKSSGPRIDHCGTHVQCLHVHSDFTSFTLILCLLPNKTKRLKLHCVVPGFHYSFVLCNIKFVRTDLIISSFHCIYQLYINIIVIFSRCSNGRVSRSKNYYCPSKFSSMIVLVK